jgi:hypothetical protein
MPKKKKKKPCSRKTLLGIVSAPRALVLVYLVCSSDLRFDEIVADFEMRPKWMVGRIRCHDVGRCETLRVLEILLVREPVRWIRRECQFVSKVERDGEYE